MNTPELEKNWKAMGDEAISGMLEWRQQHPHATFREIEREVDERLAAMRARMLSDTAMVSKSTEWERAGNVPFCPECGTKIEKKGKRERHLKTRGGQEIELNREYGVCPKCGKGIFPPG